mmetsp:Transcript_63512/g.163462  ORF Transcript_63512/g.163462 Transcript_63512/m.163462 type:complete len:220 (-) Transcript_63512:253-912(-)
MAMIWSKARSAAAAVSRLFVPSMRLGFATGLTTSLSTLSGTLDRLSMYSDIYSRRIFQPRALEVTPLTCSTFDGPKADAAMSIWSFTRRLLAACRLASISSWRSMASASCSISSAPSCRPEAAGAFRRTACFFCVCASFDGRSLSSFAVRSSFGAMLGLTSSCGSGMRSSAPRPVPLGGSSSRRCSRLCRREPFGAFGSEGSPSSSSSGFGIRPLSIRF